MTLGLRIRSSGNFLFIVFVSYSFCCYVGPFNTCFRLSGPLEVVDFFDVLLDFNVTDHIRYPGYWHRCVRLYAIFSVVFCPRSTCRHVNLFKTLRSFSFVLIMLC